MTDNSALGLPDDRAFAEYLVKEIGVACIPPGAFYSDANRHLAKNLARFSICKTDETLKAAADRLRKISI
jgi:aspartate/methionine/tyrosine aminotransferase